MLSTVAAVASLLVREVHDPDTWWQVAIGRDILANLAIPRHDHFAAAALGRSYHDSHWLFQLLLAVADRLGGMRGVGVVMVAVWSAAILSCYRAVCRWLAPAATCLLIFLVTLACSERFNARPEIVTYLMISIFCLRLQEGKYKSFQDVAVLAVLQIIWTNCHGLFVIGPFMAGCYFIVATVRKLRLGDNTNLSATVKLTILLIVATAATPFGFGGWHYAMLLMKEAGPNGPAFFKLVWELQPAFSVNRLSSPDFWPFLLLSLAFMLTTIPILLKRKASYSRLIMASAFFVAAASSMRNIPLFALTVAPVIAENVTCLLPGLTFSSIVSRGVLALGLLTFSWLPVSGLYYQMLGYKIRFGLGTATAFYPLGLPAFLRNTGFTGQIYNANYLGGFCLYHGFLPLTDGRWEVYDDKILMRIEMARYNPQEWEWLLTTYDIRGILLPNWNSQDTNLFFRIYNDRRWKLVYEDAAALFWVSADVRN